MEATREPKQGVIRRTSAFFYRHPRLRLGSTVGPPSAWIILIYLVPLVLLLVAAFWTLNVLTAQVEHTFTLSNFENLFRDPVYKTITIRTLGMAIAVTAADLVLAFPLAYYAARLATPRMRTVLLLAVVMPLWTNYLVRVFAHEPQPTIDLAAEGVADYRWWTLDELERTSERLAPPDFLEQVRTILGA